MCRRYTVRLAHFECFKENSIGIHPILLKNRKIAADLRVFPDLYCKDSIDYLKPVMEQQGLSNQADNKISGWQIGVSVRATEMKMSRLQVLGLEIFTIASNDRQGAAQNSTLSDNFFHSI